MGIFSQKVHFGFIAKSCKSERNVFTIEAINSYLGIRIYTIVIFTAGKIACEIPHQISLRLQGQSDS